MTDKPTDEGNDELEPQNEPEVKEEVSEIEDDPMIVEMKEAEAEIEKLEKEKAELEEETGTEAPEAEENGGSEEEAETDNKGKSPMIPKSRFDEVISERDLLRDQVGYMRGLLDANQKSGTGKPAGTEEGNQEADQKTDQNEGSSEVDTIDAKIDEAEKKKLELAEKYDEGEISTRDWKQAELEIDKEIRELSKQRLDQVREESRSETKAALDAAQQAEWVNDQALEIQKNHPNVAVIDATPKHIRDGIWKDISDRAAKNLAQRGIDARDQSPKTRLEFMQEKAKLTSSYTPEALKPFLPEDYTPQTQQKDEGQTTAGQKKPSEQAINRGQKIDLANSQPPSIADMGSSTGTGELSDADIENMSEDQIADLIQKQPQRVQKILGNSAQG